MDQHTTLDLLEELAERFGIQIRYEPIKQDEDLIRVVGGLCLLRRKYVLIVDSKAVLSDKIRIFVEALRHFDLDQLYMKPVLRELFDKVPASFRHEQAVVGEENT
jgi:CII-binding regulator of phage lambda lysogenization HflD